MNRWLGLGLLLIIVGAMALRIPQLGLRPMHNDEGVNAVFVQKLWQNGVYAYNPNEYHGPSLYYATLPFLALSGARDITQVDESTLRWVTVFFGTATILLVLLLADGLGVGVLAAGILLAISPAMVFYSRYFIHETLLICFTMLAVGAGWRYSRTRHIGWAMACGGGLGLMYATKETFVIPVFAMVVALGITLVWRRSSQGTAARAPFSWNLLHIAAGLLCAGVVSVLLFTSFFHNFAGLWDSVRSYLPWLNRAGGNSPHIHPWTFYLERLAWFHPHKGPVWTEGLILILALIGMFASFTGKGLGRIHLGLARFLAIYTIVLTVVYCAISYKTPWCMLGFLEGMILLAGIGVVALFSRFRSWGSRTAIAIVLLAATSHLGWEAWRANYGLTTDGKLFAADNRNPYTYSQTLPGILELVQHVQGVAKIHPDGPNMFITVMAKDHDYWPLPFYLRGFKKVGFWDDMQQQNQYAPVVITSPHFDAALEKQSNTNLFWAGFYELRPKVFLELYVQFDLWKKYVENQPRAKED